MKIHILFDIKEGPWGGANQFLKAIRDEWRKKGLYSENPENAEVLLVNSYPFNEEKKVFSSIYNLKKTKNKILIHRIDGPISLVRGKDREKDECIYFFNRCVADGTIFQSEWSKNENYKLGYTRNLFEAIIINAPDPAIFFKNNWEKKVDDKTKIIATSWSGNPRKGFDIYQFLDENLDFSRYEMTFVGNSPIIFKKIKQLAPLPSDQLSEVLRNHDIFIIASRNEPCSNSLIEALHCGLPAIYIKQGSHESIVGGAGEGFSGSDDVLNVINKVSENLDRYKKEGSFKQLEVVAEEYYHFCEMIVNEVEYNTYKPKKFHLICYFMIIIRVYLWHLKNFGGTLFRLFPKRLVKCK